MKIAFVVDGQMGANGGSKVIIQIANGLIERGHEVSLLTNSASGIHGVPQNQHPKLKVEFYDKRHGSLPKGFERYIATHYQTTYPLEVLDVPRELKYQFCQSYDDWISPDAVLTYGFDLVRICVCEWVRARVSGRFIVKPPIDPAVFYNDRSERIYDIFYIDRAEKVKNNAVGLDIMKWMQKAGYKTKVVKHGACTEQQMADLYRKSKVYLTTSFQEAHPLTPAEALMCGCVPVCRDNQGIREYYDDYVVPDDDVEHFVAAIQKAFENRPRFEFSRFSFNTPAKAAEQFEYALK